MALPSGRTARQGLVHDDDQRGARPIAGLEQTAATGRVPTASK
jgi:hypothetical protein